VKAVTAGESSGIRAKYGIAADAPLVVYTGSFVELQALPLLIDAVPLICQQVPAAKFLLVGGTDEEIAPLAQQAAALNVQDRIVFELARPQAEMPAFMAAADVLVSPRIRGINPPGKLLPYLASGKPVVATNTLVHNQLLDGSCAFLTSPDAQGLAQGVIAALTDAERSLGRQPGRRHVPAGLLQRTGPQSRLLAAVQDDRPAINCGDSRCLSTLSNAAS
jgi:glycosyltransferase involved in cell wall biosynthesis